MDLSTTSTTNGTVGDHVGLLEGLLLVGDRVPGPSVGVEVGWEVKGFLDGAVVGMSEGCAEGLKVGLGKSVLRYL
jgi:hypothetical protein